MNNKQISDLIPEVKQILNPNYLMPLNAGKPVGSHESALKSFENLCREGKYPLTCSAGLWLYHNFLDESHSISQDIHTACGSYWHALMHRREGDFWNSKYWLKQGGLNKFNQIISGLISDKLQNIVPEKDKKLFNLRTKWEAAYFVDLCDEFSNHADETTVILQKLQMLEWEALMLHSLQSV